MERTHTECVWGSLRGTNPFRTIIPRYATWLIWKNGKILVWWIVSSGFWVIWALNFQLLLGKTERFHWSIPSHCYYYNFFFCVQVFVYTAALLNSRIWLARRCRLSFSDGSIGCKTHHTNQLGGGEEGVSSVDICQQAKGFVHFFFLSTSKEKENPSIRKAITGFVMFQFHIIKCNYKRLKSTICTFLNKYIVIVGDLLSVRGMKTHWGG